MDRANEEAPSMPEHPNIELMRRAHEAIARDGFAVLADYLADDVVWHEIGRSEPRYGKAALAAEAADVDYEITFEVHDILGNDEHVVVLGDAHGTRAGASLDYRVAEIYRLRDGKIIERWAYSDDTAAITAFFA
jgi:ketosteroid isomerase-like protein